ncbi:MAG: hypothetical protein JST90_06055 [Bacteroidetes bacterium]|nr:hypothetical protein [Bacteroidota bacterium]
MFSFFKSNNPALVVINIILIVLFRFVFLVHGLDIAGLYHHTEPAAAFLIRLIYPAHMSQLWLAIAGGALCLVESLLVNRIINRHKVSQRKNYLGGILFVIFTSMIPECTLISPAQVSLLFLLLVFDQLFDLSRPEKLYANQFDLGFLSGIAMLVYFPSVFMLPLVIVGFLTMRTGTLKGIMIIFTGFASVLAIVFTHYLWYDRLPDMLPDMVNLSNRRALSTVRLTHWQDISIAWIVMVDAWILANVPGILYSSVIQTRKYITILILSGFFSLLAIALLFNFNLTHLIFVLTSLSILSAMYFVETKMALVAEILFIVLILSVFTFQYLPIFVPV